jgi:hypothetical protein
MALRPRRQRRRGQRGRGRLRLRHLQRPPGYFLYAIAVLAKIDPSTCPRPTPWSPTS